MVKDTEVTGKIATTEKSRDTRPAQRRTGLETAKITGPASNKESPFFCVFGKQHEGTWTGQVQLEPTGIQVQQESQGTTEDQNLSLSFKEYRSQHGGCWVCYGKGNNHAHDHRQCKVYEADKKAYFAAHPEKKPNQKRIADWKAKGGDGGQVQGKGQGKGGGKGYGGGSGQDRRVRSIEEVAEDMLRTLDELKAQQRGGQSHCVSQPEGAAANQV